MSFEQKYLKYKEKYLNLKNQIGSGQPFIDAVKIGNYKLVSEKLSKRHGFLQQLADPNQIDSETKKSALQIAIDNFDIRMIDTLKDSGKLKITPEQEIQINSIKQKIIERQQKYEEQRKIEEEKKKLQQQRIQEENDRAKAELLQAISDKEKYLKAYTDLGFSYVEKESYFEKKSPVKSYFEYNNYKNPLPPNVNRKIYRKDWASQIIGLKEKFDTFKNKYYIPFTKLGYEYVEDEEGESYQYGYQQYDRSPDIKAHFKYYTLKTYESELPPNGNGWEKVKEESEWDPQNMKNYTKITWKRNPLVGFKEEIYENDMDTEVAKIK